MLGGLVKFLSRHYWIIFLVLVVLSALHRIYILKDQTIDFALLSVYSTGALLTFAVDRRRSRGISSKVAQCTAAANKQGGTGPGRGFYTSLVILLALSSMLLLLIPSFCLVVGALGVIIGQAGLHDADKYVLGFLDLHPPTETVARVALLVAWHAVGSAIMYVQASLFAGFWKLTQAHSNPTR
ncbi:MAG: hypothetical protein V3R16_01490 [Nitrospirales bacterium]